MRAASSLRLLTGAKVNLFLRIVGLRPDGFHELESVFHSVDFADDLEIEATAGTDLVVEMQADAALEAQLPASDENVIARAGLALRERAGVERGAVVRVTKRIPIGAGLGGGSSNAAGALVGLHEAWGLDLDREALVEVGASVGSDVPFCLAGGMTALVTGRGEEVAVLPQPEPMWFVLGISGPPLLTRDVYREYDDAPVDEERSIAAMTMALGAGDAAEVGSLLFNDLERAALRLRPDLEEKQRALADAGALGVVVSGSGPTLCAVARDAGHAREIAGAVEGVFDRVVLTSSAPGCVRTN